MNTNQIKMFLEVANLGSFRKAAQKHQLSQRAVSHQISLLENELEVKLFVRQHNRIQLTNAGELFIKRGVDLLNFANQSKQELQNADEAVKRELNIGYFSPYDGMLIRKHILNHPSLAHNISFNIIEESVEHLISDIKLGALDLALIIKYGKNNEQEMIEREFKTQYVDSGPMMIGVSKQSKEAQLEEFPKRLLSERPILYYSPEDSTYLSSIFSSALSSSRMKLKRINTWEHLQLLVELNQSVAFYPGNQTDFFTNEFENIKYLRIENDNINYTYEYIFNKDNKNPLIEEYLGLRR